MYYPTFMESLKSHFTMDICSGHSRRQSATSMQSHIANGIRRDLAEFDVSSDCVNLTTILDDTTSRDDDKVMAVVSVYYRTLETNGMSYPSIKYTKSRNLVIIRPVRRQIALVNSGRTSQVHKKLRP